LISSFLKRRALMRNWYISGFIFILLFTSFLFSQTVELKYDCGIPYVPNFQLNEGNGWAVLFENNPQPTGYIETIKIYFGTIDDFFQGGYISIYNVIDNEPGVKIWPFHNTGKYVEVVSKGWHEIPLDLYWNHGAFVVLFTQKGYYPNCDGIYSDTQDGRLHSYEYRNGNFFIETEKNLMIRAIWEDLDSNIENTSLGTIKSLFK
jgi:hypothetical protein